LAARTSIRAPKQEKSNLEQNNKGFQWQQMGTIYHSIRFPIAMAQNFRMKTSEDFAGNITNNLNSIKE
jgi:hypothetical protein